MKGGGGSELAACVMCMGSNLVAHAATPVGYLGSGGLTLLL